MIVDANPRARKPPAYASSRDRSRRLSTKEQRMFQMTGIPASLPASEAMMFDRYIHACTTSGRLRLIIL